MDFDNNNLTLQELRTIIHSLRMMEFASLDPDAVDYIRDKISQLPSAEAIINYSGAEAMKDLKGAIGNIMYLIETYSRRDKEYKVRYESRTGLPPRYNVLEFKDVSKKSSFDVVNGIVKVSSEMDKIGKVCESIDLIEIADKLLKRIN